LGTGISPSELKRSKLADGNIGSAVVYIASLKTEPEFAAATAKTANGFPLT
jgi:hypothetical protein